MDIELLFSVLQNFLTDRPNILEETVVKLIFAVYYILMK